MSSAAVVMPRARDLASGSEVTVHSLLLSVPPVTARWDAALMHRLHNNTTTCTGTAPSAKKRLSLPKGPVGRSTTGVRKPRVVPEVEAIKADGLSDETKINALMLRLRLGSEVRWLWLPSKASLLTP